MKNHLQMQINRIKNLEKIIVSSKTRIERKINYGVLLSARLNLTTYYYNDVCADIPEIAEMLKQEAIEFLKFQEQILSTPKANNFSFDSNLKVFADSYKASEIFDKDHSILNQTINSLDNIAIPLILEDSAISKHKLKSIKAFQAELLEKLHQKIHQDSKEEMGEC
jgi:hypothetical protein